MLQVEVIGGLRVSSMQNKGKSIRVVGGYIAAHRAPATRKFLCQNNTLHSQAGSGIVAKSTPQGKWRGRLERRAETGVIAGCPNVLTAGKIFMRSWNSKWFLLIPIVLVGYALYIAFPLLLGKGKNISTGPLVIGTIQSASRTNTYLNNDPQIEFTIQFHTLDGKEMAVTDKEVIALTDLANYRPGYWVPIRYDPEQPQNIMIDFNADPKLVDKALDKYYVATGQLTQDEVEVKENGIETKGVIISSEPTGNIVNGGESEFELQIKITKRDGSPYTFNYISGVAQKDLQYAVKGAVIYVYYLPTDKSKILVEWDND